MVMRVGGFLGNGDASRSCKRKEVEGQVMHQVFCSLRHPTLRATSDIDSVDLMAVAHSFH